jgi:hypothetical protein
VSDNGDPRNNGTYETPPTTPADAAISGGHASLITDYEVDNAPGFGRLRAGVPATDAAKAAALDDAAKVVFFRIKNSWGRLANSGSIKMNRDVGFYDVYADYMTGTIKSCPLDDQRKPTGPCKEEPGLSRVALPAGY